MVTNEWLQMTAMTAGGLGFAIGGTGFKWVRRYLLPVILGVITFLSGYPIKVAAWMAVSFTVVLILGYGDRTPWWLRILVATCYSLPSLILGVTYWQILLPLIFLGMFVLSRKGQLMWKIVEFLTGVLIAITVITAN